MKRRDLRAQPCMGEHDVTRVRPPSPALFWEQQENTAATSVPAQEEGLRGGWKDVGVGLF